ncbi:hypothetical protein F5884DRAFT_505510 [Xylogone sp. PMI_703]|nr:hypothetical protein F5884DRAFT_505510 [Xylogone sp. PMI_703]
MLRCTSTSVLVILLVTIEASGYRPPLVATFILTATDRPPYSRVFSQIFLDSHLSGHPALSATEFYRKTLKTVI